MYSIKNSKQNHLSVVSKKAEAHLSSYLLVEYLLTEYQ